MTDKFIFLNSAWIWPIVIGAAVLLLIFVWKEWTQSGSRRFILKLILAFLAVGSLAIIALKPALPTGELAGKIALLSHGYDKDQLDSLQKVHKRLKLVNYKVNHFIPADLNTAESIFVLGMGVKEYDLWQLENIPVIYLGGSAPEGIIKLKYKQENTVGDSLVLKGLYAKPKPGTQLVLQGPGGTALDSLILTAAENQQFRLAAELKVPGNFLFSLVENDSLDNELSLDPIPVKVSQKDQLEVLIVNSFPTFETKYLKNFLAEAGHRVLVRSRITTGRYKYEYFNRGRMPLGEISQSTLENFDLLVIDSNSLQSLTAGERTAVENTVRDIGLGVFIQAGTSFFTSPVSFAPLSFVRDGRTEAITDQDPELAILKQPFRFSEVFALEAIHSSNEVVLSGYRRMGQGRVGTTVFENTWQLLLDGNTTAYRQFWSPIVENISKKAIPATSWQQETMIAYKDEPVNFLVRTTDVVPEVKTAGGIMIPLEQDSEISGLWKGTTWPREIGWNSLQQDTAGVFKYYVTDTSHWKSLAAHTTLRANQRSFNKQAIAGKEQGQRQRPLEPLNPLWFFGLFLICTGGLWLEPKV